MFTFSMPLSLRASESHPAGGAAVEPDWHFGSPLLSLFAQNCFTQARLLSTSFVVQSFASTGVPPPVHFWAATASAASEPPAARALPTSFSISSHLLLRLRACASS